MNPLPQLPDQLPEQSDTRPTTLAAKTRQRKKLSLGEIDRVVQMAWEDRTSFDVICRQFGLSNGEVIKLMRKQLKPSSFRSWRRRTQGRATKHEAKRGFQLGRFRCPQQKY